MSDPLADLFTSDVPGLAVRAALHLARARLVQECEGLPVGQVTWSHPRAVDVQLAEMRWSAVGDHVQVEAEEAFRSLHRCPALARCDLPRRLAPAARTRRSA